MSNYSHYLASRKCCDLRGLGPQGPQGEQGNPGRIGPVGIQGATGGIGITGPQGVTGAQGSPGGATGATGADGLRGATGATGGIGPQGFIGSTGVTGAIGATGVIGSQGSTGSTGAIGPQGTPGGITGVQGATGATGAQGFIGVTGVTGARGATGASQWVSMNGIAGSTSGYTGIGVTGQDVLIYGNLLVTGIIDPEKIILSNTSNSNEIILDTLTALPKILLENGSGAYATIENDEIIVYDGVLDIMSLQKNILELTYNGGDQELVLSNALGNQQLYIADSLNSFFATLNTTSLNFGDGLPFVEYKYDRIIFRDGSFQISNVSNDIGLAFGTNIAYLGDTNDIFNGTKITVNDTTQTISLDSRQGITEMGDLNNMANGTKLVVDTNNPSISLEVSGNIDLNSKQAKTQIGDINTVVNGTKLVVHDGHYNIDLTTTNLTMSNEGFTLPICFTKIITDNTEYNNINTFETIYTTTMDFPTFVMDVNSTFTTWKIEFALNCRNMSDQTNTDLAIYFELEDSNANVYTPFAFNDNNPYTIAKNQSTYGDTSENYTWTDYIDLNGVNGNLPLTMRLNWFASAANSFKFNWVVSLTKTNLLPNI